MILCNYRMRRIFGSIITVLFLCALLGGCTLSFHTSELGVARFEKGNIAYQSQITLRYQYAKLNKKEQDIYNKILQTISSGGRFVNTKAYDISSEACKKILNAVLCDSPDIFWVSRDFMILYESHYAKAVYFKYFDGIVLDDYDLQTDGTVVYHAQADQDRIQKRIMQLQEKTEACLSAFDCPTPLEAEIAVHDWVTDGLEYDNQAAEAIAAGSPNVERQFFDRFTVFGALMDGSAVCEGYAKLFQYFCLLKQINCTQVSGYFDNQGHMWNAVFISDGWYFVDVTFDDVEHEEIICTYSYLNINKETLLRTHAIENNLMLAVPDCVSDRLSYCKNNLINISGNQITAGYDRLIAQEIRAGKSYILLYFPDMDYSYTVLENALYHMPNPIADCINQNDKSIKKIMTLEPEYAFIFLENNGV